MGAVAESSEIADLLRSGCPPHPQTNAVTRGRSLSCGGPEVSSEVDDDLEAAEEHALGVEWHLLRAHPRHTRVAHHLGVYAIAMCARPVHDPREHHCLVALELDALRERSDLSRLHVVRDALAVFQRAVLSPGLAHLTGQATVGIDVALWNRRDK